LYVAVVSIAQSL